MRKTRKANLRKSRRKNQSGGKRSERSGSEQSGGGFWDRIKSEVKSIFTLGSSSKATPGAGFLIGPAGTPNSPPPPPPPPANMGRANALVEPPPRNNVRPSLPRSNSSNSFRTAFSNNLNLNQYNLANVPLSNNEHRRARNQPIPNNWEEVHLNNNAGREANPFYRPPNANRLAARGGSRRRRTRRQR